MRIFKILLIGLTISCCGHESRTDRTDMLQGLVSCDTDSVCVASYYFGEERDKSVIKELLTGIEDVRISHHVRHKGMSVYYCKMRALRKISGLDIEVGQTGKPDSVKINKFMDWAVDNQLIADKEKINTKSCVN